MKKEFLITVANLVTVPFEEGLLDGDTNKNHLMYIASHEINQRGFDPARAIYTYTLREYEGGRCKDTQL